MKKLVKIFLLFLFAAMNAAMANTGFVPPVPNVAARGYFLQDLHSGTVLAEKNADIRMEPASLTKLMTAYVVFTQLRANNIHLNDMVPISEKAWRAPGSRMFVEVGTRVKLEDLLRGMIVQSGNDASIALAEYVAGSEGAFAALMNEQAADLGMTDTHFVNATGLPDPGHYTTPRDIGKVAAAIVHEFPRYYSYYSEKKFTYNKITQYNRNKLLWQDPSVDGMKTGHTESAGFCLVSSARRGDMRLMSVVLGTDSEKARAQQSAVLLNYGFNFFETHRLYGANQPLKTVHVWKGGSESLALGLKRDLYVTVPRGQYQNLNASITIPGVIEAPTRKGQRIGTVSLRLGDKALPEHALVALQDVPEGGIWRRMVDEILLLFE